MGKTNFKVIGIDKIIRKAEEIGGEYEKKIRDRVIKAGFNIETQTKKNKDFPVDTGRLRASYHTEYNFGRRKNWQHTYKDKKGITYNGSFSNPPEPKQVLVGSNVEYAEKIEEKGKYLELAAETEKAKMMLDLKQITKNI